MISEEMPKGQSSFRLSDTAKSRLARAARRIGATQTQVIEEAITHYLATLEKDGPIWREVPSERDERTNGE
jgi:predicted DNA-binding protein